MARLILATTNKGKVTEIKELLKGYDYEVLSLNEAGINTDIEENGKSFEENSLIKAKAVHNLTGGMVAADDSGIEIDFLNGGPGIYSARFLGNMDYARRNNGIVAFMEGIPDEYRSCRFRCVASLVTDTCSIAFHGTIEGKIAYKPEGEKGFGYDPIFYLPEYGCTLAELDPEIKNRISHRSRAFSLLASKLKDWGAG
jgi:XTP/dITP diphosphohydrolase